MKSIVIFMGIVLLSGCGHRSLVEGEVINLKKEYYKQISYDKVKILKKSVKESKEYQKVINSLDNNKTWNDTKLIELRPFVINNTIYYPKSKYKNDFSKSIGIEDDIWALFIHENCHILYYQLGIPSKIHNYKSYRWELGLWEQLTLQDPYKIPSPSEVKQTDKLTDFGFEQQCEIFSKWALYKHTEYVKPYGKMIDDMLKVYGKNNVTDISDNLNGKP